MADGAQQQSRRFSAFISYNWNKRDRAFARRLHRKLEGYRLPRRLVRRTHGGEAAPSRLKPLFRDADELPAAADLSEAVREALADSDFLIVVCSPAAAASVWVGREIEFFRALHGDHNILAALVEGTSATAFHPALKAGGIEPLAADFRPEGPGKRLAMLKLVGALTGVWLDELVQRDAQRQVRRTVTAAASAVAATVVVVSLGGLAITARADAERRRNETTGLVEYMLTDLREATQQTGRLDQLAALNDGAMQYYRHQDLERLSETQLRQRAKLLQAMGEDDEKRGKLEAARDSFEDAHRTTAALLAAKPNDPGRIFAHAQSEYWVGFINWRTGDSAAARRGMAAYATLARRLVAIDPNNPDWRHEVAYSELNVGTLTLRLDGDGVTAERHFQSALSVLEQLAAGAPHDVGLRREVADAHAWLADSRRVKGDLESAAASRRQERAILDRVAAAEPQNLAVRRDIIGNELAMARIYMASGRTSAALDHLELGQKRAAELVRLDPSNADVAKQARMLELFKVSAQLSAPPARRLDKAELRRTLGNCDGAAGPLADAEITDFCRILEARLEALADAGHAADRVRALSTPTTRYSKRWGLDMVHEQQLLLSSAKKRESTP